jgi:type VI secretion system secreted protein Hcp
LTLAKSHGSARRNNALLPEADRPRRIVISAWLNWRRNNMAIDVYLQIDGIKGESQDASHQGWIEVIQAQWGVTQPILSSPGSGIGGRTTGRSEYRTLSLAKLADLASPVLMQHYSNGKTIPKAKLEVKWKYSQQKIGGGTGGQTAGGWDLGCNKSCA